MNLTSFDNKFKSILTLPCLSVSTKNTGFNRTHWCIGNSLELDAEVSGSKIGLGTGYGTRSLFFSGLQISSGIIALLIDNIFLSNPLSSIIYQSSLSSTSRSIQILNCYNLSCELETTDITVSPCISISLFHRAFQFHCFTVHFNSQCVMVQLMHLYVIKH
jgi:hypothetical protein